MKMTHWIDEEVCPYCGKKDMDVSYPSKDIYCDSCDRTIYVLDGDKYISSPKLKDDIEKAKA